MAPPDIISPTRASNLRFISADFSGRVSPMPALFTKISRPPKRSATRANITLTSALDETSPGTENPRSRDAPIASTVWAAASGTMSLTATEAPSSANRSAMARPMPEPAPVIRATRPSSFINPPKP